MLYLPSSRQNLLKLYVNTTPPSFTGGAKVLRIIRKTSLSIKIIIFYFKVKYKIILIFVSILYYNGATKLQDKIFIYIVNKNKKDITYL